MQISPSPSICRVLDTRLWTEYGLGLGRSLIILRLGVWLCFEQASDYQLCEVWLHATSAKEIYLSVELIIDLVYDVLKRRAY